MNKLVLAVLLFVGAIAFVQALANPEEVKLVARTKGLPPLVARQDTGYGDASPSPDATPTPNSPLAKVTGLPKLPGAVPPASPVDTGVKTTPGPSGSPAASAYSPSGTGSLIPQWSSLIAGSGGAAPTNQPSAPPALPKTTPKAATAVSAAGRIESGLIGVIIAGIVSLLF